jgi:hypothetical protein
MFNTCVEKGQDDKTKKIIKKSAHEDACDEMKREILLVKQNPDLTGDEKVHAEAKIVRRYAAERIKLEEKAKVLLERMEHSAEPDEYVLSGDCRGLDDDDDSRKEMAPDHQQQQEQQPQAGQNSDDSFGST